MNFFNNLKKKLEKKTAVVCIVGVGYVGEGLLKEFSQTGYKTIGLDINLKNLHKKKFSKNVSLTRNYEKIKYSDVIIITLPTPLNNQLKPNLSIIRKSISKMKKYLKKGQLISFESTTYPGSTRDIFVPFLNKKFDLGKDFFLTYSPERVSPEFKIKNKEIKYGLTNTPKVVSGYSDDCKKIGKILYGKIINKIVLSSKIEIAETSKMIENTFRSVNIALVNELKMFLSKIKIDIHECLDLAATKPFGFTKFVPGPGYGGHCIPIDPFYLYWLAKKKNYELKFIKTSGLVNRKITKWITDKLIRFLKRSDLALKSKRVLILGASYKADIDDVRESPTIKIIKQLKNAGYKADYSDPYVKEIDIDGRVKRSVRLDDKCFKKYPVILIATDHSVFDYEMIARKSKFLFDARNSKSRYFKKENYFKV